MRSGVFDGRVERPNLNHHHLLEREYAMKQKLFAALVILLKMCGMNYSNTQTIKGPEGSSVTFGGFVDGYCAYDFNRPAEFDRAFTTQPARHNEFNINLAFIDAKFTSERARGRVALQVGTSVQSNYAGEPGIGTISGGNLSRHIQEAVAGVKLREGWWLDGGIYFSHLGFESFISRDNRTYTRSLASDYSPYYQTGVKVSGQFSPEWSAQVHVMNGWQIISENNSNKSVGLQLAYKPSSSFSVTYNNFIGNEGSDNW